MMTRNFKLPVSLKHIFNTKMLICLVTGFSSGMPLYFLIQMLPVWLRSQGVDLQTIGLFTLVGLPYTWKFLWAPLMDRYVPPFLGRRRGWAIVTQIALLILMTLFACFDPKADTLGIAVLAFLVAFASATQDITLDAYRREILSDAELGLGNSLFVNAYRLSSLIPASLGLILADYVSWSLVFMIIAPFMLVGILINFYIPEPKQPTTPHSLREAVLEPFKEFFQRLGLHKALTVLAFMLLYKLGDSMATALSSPFYLDLGFSMSEIGTVAKAAGLWSSIVGGLIGGLLMLRIGIHRALWIFGVVQLVSILGFWMLAKVGPNPSVLFAVISFEYLGVGLGTVAFVAFIATMTNTKHTATQLALLSSLTALPRTFINASTGFLVEWLGYPQFFLLCTVVAIPGMLLLPWVAPWQGGKGRSDHSLITKELC